MTETSQSPAVVLMVDDTPANLGVLYELLSEAGYDVLVAERGTPDANHATFFFQLKRHRKLDGHDRSGVYPHFFDK